MTKPDAQSEQHAQDTQDERDMQDAITSRPWACVVRGARALRRVGIWARGPAPVRPARRRQRLVSALGLSSVLHVVVGVAAIQVSGPGLPAAVVPEEPLHELEVTEARLSAREREAQDPVPDEPHMQARVGDPDERRDQASADTLCDGQPGAAAGQGRARPHDNPLAGDDLDDLRFRPFNHPSRDSESRLPTEKRLVSPDNRRTTPNPMLSMVVVSQNGASPRRDPFRATVPRPRTEEGQSRPSPSGLLPSSDEPSSIVAAEEPGIEPLLRPGAHGRARPAFRRPELQRAPPTTVSRRPDPDLADHKERSLASRQRRPDLLDAARSQDRGTDTGAGAGSQAGRRGDPHGEDHGQAVWLSAPDPRFALYFRRVHAKIQPLWSFPKSLEVLLEQGDVIVEFTILSDGQIRDLRIRKSSGFPHFDQNVVAAVLKAAPFGPIPPGLGPSVKVIAPFEFQNPLVR